MGVIKRAIKALVVNTLRRFGLQLIRLHPSERQSEKDLIVAAYDLPPRQKTVLLIEDRIPFPELGAGFPRTYAMVNALAELNYEVDIFPLRDFDENLESVGKYFPKRVRVLRYLNMAHLRNYLSRTQNTYNAIILCRPHNMLFLSKNIEVIRRRFSDAKIIYDAEAIFAVREKLYREHFRKPPLRSFEENLSDEIALAKLSDAVISVSKAEAANFIAGKVNNVHVLGHSIASAKKYPAFKDRSGVLFFGAYHGVDSPNHNAVMWLIREIIPLISPKTKIKFTIAGFNMDQLKTAESIAETNSLRILGTIADPTELLHSHRVFICPMRYAAGVPLKILDAVGQGMPVVGTSLIANQLGWQSERDLLCGDSAAELVRQIVRLHESSTLWQKIVASGRKKLQAEYSPQIFKSQLRAALQDR